MCRTQVCNHMTQMEYPSCATPDLFVAVPGVGPKLRLLQSDCWLASAIYNTHVSLVYQVPTAAPRIVRKYSLPNRISQT